MTWNPVGIYVPPSFRAYVEALQETWQPREPNRNQGIAHPTTGSDT